VKTRVQRPDSVLIREIAGESVLLDLESESYFGLDEVGTRMWAALAESPDTEAALETLLAEYDVDRDVLRADLDAFVAQLAEAGLVRVENA
jgi:Coenzyme PQQ synthesis protein D (PqqD)